MAAAVGVGIDTRGEGHEEGGPRPGTNVKGLAMHDIDQSYMETTDQESFPFQAEDSGGQMEDGEVLSDGEVEQLAAELLSISNERDLDHFLGSLIKKAGSAIGKFANS